MRVVLGFQSSGSAKLEAGFTMVELIVTIAVLGILATLFVPELGKVRDVAGRAVCAGHLRSLHCSFGAYLNDNDVWPQCPEELEDDDDEQFWIDVLKDYGATAEVWKCPSLSSRLSRDPHGDPHKIHYTPTQFDDNPITPRKRAAQPWLIEIASAHGGSNLLIRADGAVMSVNDLVRELQGN